MSDHNIIVYRNPAEKLFWENNGPLFLSVFFIVTVLVFVAVYHGVAFFVGDKMSDPVHKWLTGVALGVAFFVGGICAVMVREFVS